MKWSLTHKSTVSLFRATCEQEPNYLQTFTSLSRWSRKAESQTASQCSILTIKASVQSWAADRQPNKNIQVATGFRTFMLQSRVAPLSRVAECALSRLPRRPRPGQSGQHRKIPVSETQRKPELCPCHVTLVQTEQVCPSELKSHHDVRIPMWKADSHQEKVGQECLAIQNTTLSEAGRLDLSRAKKMMNMRARKQLINVLFPSVHFLLWCSRVKYCTVKSSSPPARILCRKETQVCLAHQEGCFSRAADAEWDGETRDQA